MTNLEKLKLLKLLYQHKSMGFEYFSDLKSIYHKRDLALPGSMDELKTIVTACHMCSLSKTRKNVVFGDGNINADLMFVGEGPGANEDESGHVFVGRAGELLSKIIENVFNLRRDDVYIANIVKCRPPLNRVPNMDEVSACKDFILQQIRIVNPKVLVALGSTAFHHLTGDYETKISRVRGEVLKFGGIDLVPTFHPSFLLRNPSSKKEVFQDMLTVKRLLAL